MRLLIIHPSDTQRGGIVNATLAHAVGLRLLGHSVEVWTASAPLAAACHAHQIPVLSHPAMRHALKMAVSRPVRGKSRALRGADIDAVIHEGAKSWLWARTSMPRVPHAVVFHNRKMGGRRRFRHWLVLSSRHAADLASNRRGRADKTIQVIRNGCLSAGECSGGTAPGAAGGDGVFRIGVLCEFLPNKGIDLLLKAAAGLIARGGRIRLVIGGAGPESPALERLADDLGISASVQWPGWVEDRAAFFREIDCFCLLSRSESFGLALVEAMAAGTPVVASRTDGPCDIVTHGETGWLFPVGDHQGLGEVLADVIADAANRARVAERGRLHAERSFSPAAAAGTIEQALTNILSQRT